MSQSSTPLTESMSQYVQSLFNSEDDFLRNLNSEAIAAGIPAISIAPEQTRFLQVLLRAIKANVVLEIGSLAGYSAIAMARALPSNGILYACELEPHHADFITTKARQAELDHIIHVAQGPALETVPQICTSLQRARGNRPIDAVFIDADKPNYLKYLDLTLPFVRSGGVIIGDNALGFGYITSQPPPEEAHNVEALRSFNQTMSSHPALLSTLIPLGDGMVVGLVIE